MPAGFDKCVAAGGRVRTVKGPNQQMGLAKGEYVHICILRGTIHRGEVKKEQNQSKKS